MKTVKRTATAIAVIAIALAITTMTPRACATGTSKTMPEASESVTGVTGTWTFTVPCYSPTDTVKVLVTSGPITTELDTVLAVQSDGNGGWQAVFTVNVGTAGNWMVRTESPHPGHGDDTEHIHVRKLLMTIVED